MSKLCYTPLMLLRFLVLLIIALSATPAAAQLGGPPNITAQLVAEGPVEPGGTVDLAISMTPKPGWHGYWQNPGDAGQPMRVKWNLPAGASVAPLRYPVPQRLTIAGLMNYVFEGPHALLTRISVPANARGILPIRAEAEWLACTDRICVPERGTLSLDLPVRAGAATERERFDEWRRALPRPLATPAYFASSGDRLQVAVPIPANVAVSDPYLFAATENAVNYAGAQRFRRVGDTLVAELPRRTSALSTFDGVLAIGDGSGLELQAVPGKVPSGGTVLGEQASMNAALWALLGALVGGLLLNLMPCVFPILALKALALARSGGDERHARRDALAYAAGAILGTGGLGIVLLLLRASGEAAGWAFQLQDPRTVFAMLLLAVAITLNLLGLVRLPVIGSEANPRSGFATGLLAAFVATPCAGPFLGAALGTALLLPPAAGVGVFATLGLGLALPFLLVAFIPALRTRLPKPGAWMRTLQRVLAVPMALTAAACLWLLWRLGGADLIWIAALAAVLFGLALAAFGSQGEQRSRWGWGMAALALVASAGVVRQVAVATPQTVAKLTDPAWSEAEVADLRAQNVPVFVYFTADWCLTCKVNEGAAIDRPAVRVAFAEQKVAVRAADWTRGDPAITRFLEARGRAGVPLYLWYAPGSQEPEELPQLLTPGMLTARAGGRS